MLARMRNQFVCSLLRLGCPARRDRRQALVDQGIGESVTMDGLSGMPEPLIGGSSRLVGVAAVPECQCPSGLSGNADVCAKPERKVPMLLGPVQFNSTIEVGQRFGVIP